jgi:hypothetical protein
MEQTYFARSYSSLTVTSGNESFLQELVAWMGSDDLSTTLSLADGESARIKSIRVNCIIDTDSARFYAAPVLIKTEGAITSAVSASTNDIETLIANHCASDFGFNIIHPFKLGQVARGCHISDAHVMQGREWNISIPKNFIKMLNKLLIENEATNYALAMIGNVDFQADPRDYIGFSIGIEMKFTVEAKKINLR